MILFTFFNVEALAVTSPTCTVPSQLSGKTLLLSVDEEYSVYTPEVIGLMQLTFNKDTFVNYVIQSNYFFPGQYSYQLFESDLGVITLVEVIGNLVSKYQLLLVCISNIEGYFVYSLEYGDRWPNVKHNTGLYMLRE